MTVAIVIRTVVATITVTMAMNDNMVIMNECKIENIVIDGSGTGDDDDNKAI